MPHAVNCHRCRFAGTMFVIVLRNGPAGQDNKQLYERDGELYFDPGHTRSLRHFYAENYLMPPAPPSEADARTNDPAAAAAAALVRDIQRPGYFSWPDGSDYKLRITVSWGLSCCPTSKELLQQRKGPEHYCRLEVTTSKDGVKKMAVQILGSTAEDSCFYFEARFVFPEVLPSPSTLAPSRMKRWRNEFSGTLRLPTGSGQGRGLPAEPLVAIWAVPAFSRAHLPRACLSGDGK